MDTSFDAIILGAGAIGRSIAIQSNPSLKLAIVDGNSLFASTINAGAMINVFAEVTETHLKCPYNQYKLQMAYQARQLWESYIKTIHHLIEDEPIKINKGTHIILNSVYPELKNFGAVKIMLEKYKEPFKELSPFEMDKLEGINPFPSHLPLYSLFLPNEASIDMDLYLSATQKALSKLKHVTCFSEFATSLKKQGGVYKVTLKDKQITAPKIVLAVGAYTNQFLKSLEVDQNIQPVFSQAGLGFELPKPFRSKSDEKKPPLKYVIRTPNDLGSCGLHLVPKKNSVYVGATGHFFFAPKKKLPISDLLYLLDRVTKSFDHNWITSSVLKQYFGNRPISLDSFPLIGKTSFQGLYLATSSFRDGWTSSPLIGKYIADLLEKDTSSLLPNHPFSPERSCLSTYDIKTSIHLCADYLSTTETFSPLIPSAYPFKKWSKQSYAQLAENFYQKTKVKKGLPIGTLLGYLSLSAEEFKQYEHHLKWFNK